MLQMSLDEMQWCKTHAREAYKPNRCTFYNNTESHRCVVVDAVVTEICPTHGVARGSKMGCDGVSCRDKV